MKSFLSVLTPEESQGISKRWFDGSTQCATCGTTVMVPVGSVRRISRVKLALASHVLAIHTKQDALGHPKR